MVSATFRHIQVTYEFIWIMDNLIGEIIFVVTIPSALDYFPCSKEDLVFPTAEAAFQAYKSPNDNDYVQSQVSVENPKKSKGATNTFKAVNPKNVKDIL